MEIYKGVSLYGRDKWSKNNQGHVKAESVADAAMVHGLDGDDIVKYLNEYIEASQKEAKSEAEG